MSTESIELMWLIVNLISLVMCSANVSDAWGDYRAVHNSQPARVVAARGNLRRESVRVAIVLSLMAPLVFLEWAVLFLMLAAVGMGVNSYLDRRMRRILTSMPAEAFGDPVKRLA